LYFRIIYCRILPPDNCAQELIRVKVFTDLYPYSVKRGSYVTYMDTMLNSCARVSELSFFVAVAGKAQLLYSLETSFPPHDRWRRVDRENKREREKETKKE